MLLAIDGDGDGGWWTIGQSCMSIGDYGFHFFIEFFISWWHSNQFLKISWLLLFIDSQLVELLYVN